MYAIRSYYVKYSKQACSSNIFVAQDNGLCAIIKLPNTTKNSEQYEKIDEEDLKSNTDVSDKRDFDNNNSVITSYSIHYTKLYELFLLAYPSGYQAGRMSQMGLKYTTFDFR